LEFFGLPKASPCRTVDTSGIGSAKLFLGKSKVPELNRNYERAAAILAKAATPALSDHQK